MTPAERRVAETIRAEGAHIVATLVRIFGDLQLAEDAVQDAAVRALKHWPVSGVPDSPRAWLLVAARRAAVDAVRRDNARPLKERAAMSINSDEEPTDHAVDDDVLRLLFTCAHPALSLDAQVTLALRVLCGLSTEEIAAVLLSSESAVAKRLSRTRVKIARAEIPYEVPAVGDLPQRLSAVCSVVHALYTNAHTATGGDRLSDVDGCAEAIRLARLVCQVLPDEATPEAVLALLLLTEARRTARTGHDGLPIPLAEQDRRLWDIDSIREGLDVLEASLTRTNGMADAYQLQAAIAAQHAVAASYEDTDWDAIVVLYDWLLQVHPTPSAAMARAVAIAENQGSRAGLAALDQVARNQRWHAVRGELLARDHHYAAAIEETLQSLTAEVSAPEANYRRRQIARWTADDEAST